METRQLTCIGCPLGCALTVEMEGKLVLTVSGNTCKKGDSYARKEVTDPTRMFTSTVRVQKGVRPVVPVKTTGEIPKDKLFECAGAIRELQVKAPVASGQVLAENICGFGVDLIATDDCPA